ncbi:MAG: hypothetical protein MZV63_38470 [Marinilabiliales bacterium]|nr:hypothetical protein [Marinilabiliales bacterium]
MVWIPLIVTAQAGKSLPFKAGASKIDITPAEQDIPAARFKYGIRDHLYIRAVVVDNGVASAALVSVDVSTVPDNLYKRYIQLIEKETGIPANNIIVSPSHSHSSVRLPVNDAKPDDPKVALFAANFEKSIVAAVRKAKENLHACPHWIQDWHLIS